MQHTQQKIRGIFALGALALGLTSFGVAFGADYNIDPAHSSVTFTVKHNMISEVSGTFKDFTGTFSFDEKKPEASAAKVTIKADSVDTGNDQRDKHLKSEDFFNADKNPEITFVSKSVKKSGKNKFKLSGDLTLRGVTKPVTFDVEHHGNVTDMQGAERAGFTATTKINRKDYGVSWNKALDHGGVVISEEVQIAFKLEGVKQGADPKGAAKAEDKAVKADEHKK